MSKGDALEAPFFNVSTKAVFGLHDENLPYKKFKKLTGAKLATILKQMVLGFGNEAFAIAKSRGVLLKDGKVEMGLDEYGRIMFIDEAWTSDAARPESIADGRVLSKEPVREYLKSIGRDKGTSELLPDSIINQTNKNYADYYWMLTGQPLFF
jgi:phosphoribosylaminoimidazole-succinocarboxamide synthase